MNVILNEYFVEINCQLIDQSNLSFSKIAIIFCAIFEYQSNCYWYKSNPCIWQIEIFQSLYLTDKVRYIAIYLVALFTGNVKRAVKTTL